MRHIKKLLVANRSEIAIRIFRAASELGIKTVAIYAEEDRFSLHRLKADEAYQIGHGKGPLGAYLSIEDIISCAVACGADAIHPGYGFLSESPEFAAACQDHGIKFIGPMPETMRLLGNKIAARELSIKAGVPVIPASGALPSDLSSIAASAAEIGYPLMIKASWGGGGRGMRILETPDQLQDAVASARREAGSAFGKDEVYLEKFIARARHVEVQLLGDEHGNLVHLFERDCSIQRRNQKVVERAPALFLTDDQRRDLCEAALRIGRASAYSNAGTVEFLVDRDTGSFYFIEVNPRIQVEHTVTEQITDIDIVKAQIRIAEGGRIGHVEETGVPPQHSISSRGHAIQCRITTENPEAHFIPDYGRITAFRGPMGFGVRTDGGTAYSGALVTRFYDPLLEKVIVWGPNAREATDRMSRALREYRVRGVATNLEFLENLIDHPAFIECEYDTRFIDTHPEILQFPKKRDRASKLLNYLADVSVNPRADLNGRPRPQGADFSYARRNAGAPDEGPARILRERGASGFAEWIKSQKKVFVTDTSFRDAHQSLLATRMRTFDLAAMAPEYASALPHLFSIECWGGATFDVSMRFLNEDPWERLALLRERAPNLNLQMLIRGANAVGYKNYPRNAVDLFVRRAAASGIDIFRVFDCFNVISSMRRTIEAVLAEGKVAEGAICYSGDLLDPDRSKFDLSYYLRRAEQLIDAGCHILCIKDMAGLLRPEAARVLVASLKREFDRPVHLHTHDTSGIAAASVLAAVDAGVDIVDLAMDSMSGLTSQPCLGSVVHALRGHERDPQIEASHIRTLSGHWERIRKNYVAFETDLRSGASEVFKHEMPGGQFTNLKEQARSLGLGGQWTQVAEAYADANRMFGDIVKVTPSSKVVGDMALAMVSQGVTAKDVLDASVDFSFPSSVIDMLQGGLGVPEGGWPEALLFKALGSTQQPEPEEIQDMDLEDAKRVLERRVSRTVSENDLASWLMYPEVFEQFATFGAEFGSVSALPTLAFFYGMKPGEEISVDLEQGKTIIIRLVAISDVLDGAERKVFFELNGEPRMIRVADRARTGGTARREKANPSNPKHVPSPIPGVVSAVFVKKGDKLAEGSVIASIEAMKMETLIRAESRCTVESVSIVQGDQVEAKDLIAVLNPE